MIIGIYFDKMKIERGGAITYVHDILSALGRLKHHPRHRFVLFGWDSSPPDGFIGGNMRYVSLKLSSPEIVASETNRVLNKGLRAVRILGRDARPVHPRKEIIDRKILRSGIHVLWCLTQNVPTREIPYVFPLMDLAHRIHPYFPEVSRNGTWDDREDFFRKTLGRASFVLAGTARGKEEIIRFYQVPEEKIRVVPLPTPSFTSAPMDADAVHVLGKHGLPPDFLFYPARFWPHKNHVAILRAAREIRDRGGREYPVVFAGYDSGNRRHIETAVRDLGLADSVHILGHVSYEELACLYKKAFALVFPSYFGPDNLPPLEAFALGCPVLAADVPGAREQLGDAALFFDPSDHRSVADAVHLLQGDDALRRGLTEKGKIRAANWRAEHYIDSVMSLMDEFEPVRSCWP